MSQLTPLLPPVHPSSEKLFTQIADALIAKGYKAAGYDRVNIDDCWMMGSRDLETGTLLPDPVRFPNGIKYLSDYVRNEGLYSSTD